MGRIANGFAVRYRAGWAYCCFTWHKHEYRIPLRTREAGAAQEAAARAYAEVISGRRRPLAKRAGTLLDLGQLLNAWIAAKAPTLDEESVSMLEGYGRRYLHHFGSLDCITDASGADFARARLGQVLRTCVLRELAYLRQFLAWCKEQRALMEIPIIPELRDIAPKAQGKRSGPQRAKPPEVTPREVARITAKLPVASKKIGGRTWPIRDRFAFAWETTLRPETLSRLSVPENWRHGWTWIDLANEDDKARYGRTVDLTPKAVAILERVAKDSGPIFGRHCFDKRIKTAAKLVLDAQRAKVFAPYDYRHTRAKQLIDETGDLRGVAYVLGHLQLTTTNRYTKPDRKAGARVLGVRIPGQFPDRKRRRARKTG